MTEKANVIGVFGMKRALRCRQVLVALGLAPLLLAPGLRAQMSQTEYVGQANEAVAAVGLTKDASDILFTSVVKMSAPPEQVRLVR